MMSWQMCLIIKLHHHAINRLVLLVSLTSSWSLALPASINTVYLYDMKHRKEGQCA